MQYNVNDAGLNFGQALEALKEGHKVSREGWNGKGMFLVLVPGYSVPLSEIWGRGHITREFLESRGQTHLVIQDHIDMWTAGNTLCVGWLASQLDMQATDWCIV